MNWTRRADRGPELGAGAGLPNHLPASGWSRKSREETGDRLQSGTGLARQPFAVEQRIQDLIRCGIGPVCTPRKVRHVIV
ncbi:MAG TPA: hypothetical protein VG253_09875 [Streptosporangiaceae bacterium]|jgi:hypothetical protein|nr:hypothetical protein [Streptosporangiaceae bacterium]